MIKIILKLTGVLVGVMILTYLLDEYFSKPTPGWILATILVAFVSLTAYLSRNLSKESNNDLTESEEENQEKTP
jgi:F0F1-type ATP synthase assembly protein I